MTKFIVQKYEYFYLVILSEAKNLRFQYYRLSDSLFRFATLRMTTVKRTNEPKIFSLQISSMLEVSHACHDKRNIFFFGGANHFIIAH